MKVLDLLTKEMIQENHSDLVVTLKEYLSLATEFKKFDLLASKSRFLIQQYIIKGENKKALALCDSILSYKPMFKKRKSEAHLLLKRGGIAYAELNYDKAINDYYKAATLFLEEGGRIFAADAYFFAGQANSNTGKFIKAIQDYEIAHNLYEKEKDYNYMFLVLKELDLIYRRNGLESIANENLPKLINKAKKYKAYGTLEFLYMVKLEESIKKSAFELARKYLDSSNSYSSYIKDNTIKGVRQLSILKLLLRLHLKENNLVKATKSYNDLIDFEKKFKQTRAVATASTDKANYLLNTNKLNEALNLLLKYKAYSESNSVTNVSRLEVEKMLSRVYKESKNFKKAVEHQNNYIQLKDSIHKWSLTNGLAFYQTKFETFQKEKEILQQKTEIQQLEIEKQSSVIKRNLLIALLSIIVLMAIGIWWKEKVRREQLNQEITRNQEELSNFTNQLLQKSKEQEFLSIQLKELQEVISEKEALHSIEELMTHKILTKDDWYSFKEKFIKVHPKFFTEIKGKGYKLTKSEERLVALEKLGLDNNEIANMLGVSLDSVFISRYRLRKKIEAPKEISLIEYLS